ncbi:MAG: DUF4097 family beta strand repeat-containing protein [Oscillospiraceae bacterium]|jgi:hypothetical protein|nr:DUF4097 family beta strand repeat-containing protein [Oscillospiraceae bacterium]
MNKNEYMAKLSAELRARRGDESADGLLADFYEHFDEALRDGKSEEDVCLMLGDPAEIVAEYCEDVAADTAPPDDAGVFISLAHMSLLCEPCDGDTFRVEIWRNNKVVRDDTIKVRQTQNSLHVIKMREQDLINYIFRAFRFREIVRVGIPRRICGDMTVKMSSGSVRINEIAISGDMTCNVSSGSIRMLHVATDQNLSVNSRSGSISIDSCSGELSVECHSGSIRVKSHKGNILRAASSSGTIRVEAAQIKKDCAITAKSGSIHAEFGLLEANLDIGCRSGSAKFIVRELKGNITGKISSGSIVGYLARDTRAVFLLQSATIRNKFPNAVMPDSSVPVVNLTSRSGRVSVKEL